MGMQERIALVINDTLPAKGMTTKQRQKHYAPVADAILAIKVNGRSVLDILKQYKEATKNWTHVICERCGIQTRHMIAHGDKSLHCVVCEPFFEDDPL